MRQFTVPDMHCEGCVKSITAAVQRAAPGAQVETDLATHRIAVATEVDAEVLAEAMRDAGFTPEARAA
jgi:copper chaperone